MYSHRCRCSVLLLIVTVSAFTATAIASNSQKRDLCEVTYLYNSCGNEGRNGPNHERCLEYYINSSIVQDNVFTEVKGYSGAQGFRVRRSGWYNLTVAGATGGRGLCSLYYGRGAVLKVTAYLTAGHDAAILVGQNGTGPCDVDPSHELCLKPPVNVNESENCSRVWENKTEELFVRFSGGGAGGGASGVVLLRNDTELEDLPLVMSGGGSGTGATYDTLAYVAYYNATENLSEAVQIELDGKNESYYVSYNTGKSGEVYTCINFDCKNDSAGPTLRPGVGGGWKSRASMTYLSFDGGSFTDMEPASGGHQCTTGLFEEVNGGFGGGGGGCGGGGGGGGYTGGAAVRDTPLGCGEGGFSFVANSSSGKEVVLLDSYTNDDAHGFVEIVPVDCGCIGSCVVYESDQFECVCPENSVLAPDQSDCYKNDVSLSFSMNNSLQVEKLFTSGLIFTEKLFLYSMGARLSPVNEEATAAIILIGYVDEETESESFVLVSDPVKTSGKTSSLAVFNKTGRGEIGDYEEFLQERVLVTGAVVLSTSPCDVGEISAKISIQKLQEDPIALVKIQSLVNDTNILEFASEILGLIPSSADPPTSTTASFPTSPKNSMSDVLTISLSVAGSILFIILLLCSILFVCIFKKRIKKQTNNTPEEKNLEVTEERKYEVIDLGDEVENSACNKSVPLHFRYEMMQYTDSEKAEQAAPKFSPKFGFVTPSIDFSPYNKARIDHSLEDWTYPRDKLIYMRELGEGQFGKVLLMKAADGIAGYEQPLPVAVKTITSTDPEVVKNFGQEAELMKKFCHPNIVSLLGYTAGYKENQISTPLMIIEYMCYGDLEGFLKSNRPQEGKTSQVTLTHCYRFAIDVAKALDFLSSMHYIHRDIASRNCLVGSDLKVKIADFGMARGVHSKDYYKIAGSAVLPVRWMAPENLLLGVFTTASDVWSFGVLLLEIITFAALPLEGIASQEIIEMAQKSTLQHKRPADCPDEWFQILKSCHMISPQERPKPSEVLDALQEAMKMLLAVAEFEPESPQQHVGFPDTTESLTHEISLEQSGDIDLHALVPVRVSLQPVGFTNT